MSIYAEKGEFVCCENGHRVAQFLVSVYYGDVQDISTQLHFLSHMIPFKPHISQDVDGIRCFCGAEYVRPGGIFNFSDGWRWALDSKSPLVEGDSNDSERS